MSSVQHTGRVKVRRLVPRDPQSLILPAFILFLAVVTGLIEPRFWSVNNLLNLGRQIVPLLIIAVGQGFAIVSGGLDLSLAAVLSLSGVAGVLAMNQFGIAIGLAVMVLTGLVAGFTSGLIVSFFRATPLIVTLGMLSVAQGLALILSGGVPIYNVPPDYASAVGFGELLGIPVPILIGAGGLLAGHVLLRHTVFGRYVYAIGSNVTAAYNSGINVRLYTMLVYVVSGGTAGIAAIVLTAWVSAAQPVAAPSLALESIAAVVLGGVALTGGKGGMSQVLCGVIILGMLSNAMNMIGVSAYFQTVIIGVVIVVAVILDRFRRRGGLGD